MSMSQHGTPHGIMIHPLKTTENLHSKKHITIVVIKAHMIQCEYDLHTYIYYNAKKEKRIRTLKRKSRGPLKCLGNRPPQLFHCMLKVETNSSPPFQSPPLRHQKKNKKNSVKNKLGLATHVSLVLLYLREYELIIFIMMECILNGLFYFLIIVLVVMELEWSNLYIFLSF